MSGGNLVRTYDPNAVLQAAFSRFFDHVEIDEAWLNLARDAAKRGPVVYVMRNLSFLDFMALDHLTHRHGLPGLGFANDLGLWVLEPFAETWSEALFNSHRNSPKERLTEVIENGGSAALFLKRFAPTTGSWVHLDIFAWNPKGRPGWPSGAEAQAIRALFKLIKDRFG